MGTGREETIALGERGLERLAVQCEQAIAERHQNFVAHGRSFSREGGKGR
jgi:hypothetical protein